MFSRWRLIPVLVVLALCGSLVPGTAALASVTTSGTGSTPSDAATVDPDQGDDVPEKETSADVPEASRDASLGEGWRASDDLAWTVSGDEDSLKVLIARESEGYRWAQVAALKVDGFDTDRWVGNACLASDGSHLAVVYAPRTFANREALFLRGAFAAVVDVLSGDVVELGSGFSLASFNPGCGADGRVALVGYDDTWKTKVASLDVAAPQNLSRFDVPEFVTSVVPGEGTLVGVLDSRVVELAENAEAKTIAQVDGQPFDLKTGADGSLAFLAHDGSTSRAMYVSPERTAPTEIARGAVEDLGIASTANGALQILGTPSTTTADLPPGVGLLPDTDPLAVVSSHGDLVVSAAFIRSAPVGSASPAPDQE